MELKSLRLFLPLVRLGDVLVVFPTLFAGLGRFFRRLHQNLSTLLTSVTVRFSWFLLDRARGHSTTLNAFILSSFQTLFEFFFFFFVFWTRVLRPAAAELLRSPAMMSFDATSCLEISAFPGALGVSCVSLPRWERSLPALS